MIDRIVTNVRDAHSVASAGYTLAKRLLSNGKPVRITVKAFEDDRTLRQNRYYWGCVLKEISEQASIQGQRWTAEAWHELCKRQFLGYEITKVAVAGRRKKHVIRRLRSTTNLKVREMNEYLEKVQAFAADDLGVRFSVPHWEQWHDAS